jgi:hypothetical protein
MCAHGATVIVGQGPVTAGLLLVLDDLLCARCSASELPVVAQVLATQASGWAVWGRIGDCIVFRLSTACRIT